MTLKNKFAWTIFSLQFIFIIIYGIFAKYGPDVDASDPKHNTSPESGGQRPKDNILNKDYPMFQDINAMIFIGIGFLYAFLRKYSYTGVGMNFLLCAIGVQWGMITKGVWNMRNGKLNIDVTSLVQGEFAAASGMIALGGIFGKAGLIQMVAFVIIEIFVYSATDYFSHNYLQVSDVGESVALHLFAAIFGCSAAYTLDKKVNVKGNPNESTSYNSNLFCILGTVVLWVYWPSFNSAGDEGDSQHRNVINTFLGLLGSAITCFAMSALLNKKSKFTMSHIQNGALAGAVGVGSTSNLMIQPFGALAIGALSGCLSVAGFKYFSPLLGKFNVYDPCGINSLHGLPGLFAGILGILATFLADKETYGSSLYKFYPAMVPLTNTTELYELQANSTIIIEPGIGRTIEYQALYQFIYILVTIAISCLTGLITGAILRMEIFDPIEDKQMYIDDIMWELPDIEADQPIDERKLSQMSAKL